MTAEDWPEEPLAEQPDEGDEGAAGDASTDEELLVVLPEGEGEEAGGGMDSFFDEAEANVDAEAPAEPAAEPEEGEAEPEVSGEEAPPAEEEPPLIEEVPAEAEAEGAGGVLEGGPVPVTVLDVAPDGFRYVYPQITDYLGQGYLFFIVNASAIESLPQEELTLLVDLDAEVRGQGGQLVFCGFQDTVRGAIDEMGLYDNLSLTETEEEASDWTRKIVMENTGSDVQVSRVPVGGDAGGEVPEAVSAEMDGMVTQPMVDEEEEQVVDLSEDAIVEEGGPEEPVYEEAPADVIPTPEMVTQEIPGDYHDFLPDEPGEPAFEPAGPPEPDYQIIRDPAGEKFGHTRIRPKAVKPIVFLIIVMGGIIIGFQQLDLGSRLLGIFSGEPTEVVELPGTTGGGGPGPGPASTTGPPGAVATDGGPGVGAKGYQEALEYSVSDILGRR